MSLLAVFAAVAAFVALVFTADGSALLDPTTVTLTATGPTPSTVEMLATENVLVFVNDDSVSHSVDFANGQCSLDVAPGDNGGTIQTGVNACYPLNVGTNAYSVDGQFPGSVDVMALYRSVSLTGRTHTIRRGSRLTLHGELTYEPEGGEAASPTPPFPVVVLVRGKRQHAFHPLALVSATRMNGHLVWRVRVRPRVQTTYVAELRADRDIWEKARSGSFTVRIRR